MPFSAKHTVQWGLLTVLWCSIAMGQNTDASCTGPNPSVPKEVGTISSVLGIGPVICRIVNPQSPLSSAPPEGIRSFVAGMNSPSDRQAAEAALAQASRDVNAEAFQVQELYSKKTDQNYTTGEFLKISGIIIGGVGGVAGGALRLDHHPSVSHLGTVFGIVGGGTGALINIAALVWDHNHRPRGTEIAEKAPSSVQLYMEKRLPASSFDTLAQHPSRIAGLLLDMQKEIDASQNIMDCGQVDCIQRK